VIRFILTLVIIVGLGYCGATVKLGDKTFFEHVRAIWHSPETQDLKRGVEQTAAPAVHKLEHGAAVGYHAMTSDDAAVGSAGSAGSATPR
jgi:hypothetical protein